MIAIGKVREAQQKNNDFSNSIAPIKYTNVIEAKTLNKIKKKK